MREISAKFIFPILHQKNNKIIREGYRGKLVPLSKKVHAEPSALHVNGQSYQQSTGTKFYQQHKKKTLSNKKSIGL